MNIPNHRRSPISGFTLVELMIVVAIIAVLASIAVPQYSQYVRRSQIQEALSTMLEYRTRLEQYYQNNRGYGVSGTANCGVTPAAFPNLRFFQVACTVPNVAAPALPQTYTLTATGIGGNVSGGNQATYTVDEQNVRQTTFWNSPVALAPPRACWLVGGGEC